MSVQSLVPWLLLAMVSSIAGMVVSAAAGDGSGHLLSAIAFFVVLLCAGAAVNWPYWRTTAPADASESAMASRRNARLFTFAYAWGGAAMAADYSLTPLRWRHDWQYAIAMIIAALVCFVYAIRVTRPNARLATPRMLRWAAIATGLQAIGAMIGIVHLIGSGKIWTFATDWAANHIFLIGGALLVGLSLFGLLSYRQTAATAQ